MEERSIAAILAERAVQRSAIAFINGRTGDVLRWDEIERSACVWATRWMRLRYAGLSIADPLRMVECLVAGTAAGATLVPLDPACRADELAARTRALGLSCILTDRPDAAMAALPGATAAPTEPNWPQLVSLPAVGAGAPPVWLSCRAALVLASSGTTGSPKIVPLTDQQLVRTATAVARHHDLGERDRGYCPLPLFHVNAIVVGVLSTLVTGGSLVVDARFSARTFWGAVREHDVTWLNLVPAIITVLSTTDPPGPEVVARVRFARSASAPLPGPARERFEQRCGVTVLETYGMTEAASQITANPLDPAARRAGSVGIPTDVELRVVGTGSRRCTAGAVGNVEIRGERVTPHYLTPVGPRPALSEDGWLRTGDIGWADSEGFVYLEGRDDDVINRGGEKIYPREIEDVLSADDAVRGAAVVGRPDAVFGEVPVAFVLAHPVDDREALVGRLNKRCAHELSHYKRPAAITVVDALPVGMTGKILRAEVRRTAHPYVRSA